MHRLAKAAFTCGLAVAVLTPALAQSDPANLDLRSERAAIERYQEIDRRLQDIGWKLAQGNAPFCAQTTPSVGLQLHDLASYGSPEIARAALSMRGSFAVQTAAAGSPADTSGQYPANREIAQMGSVDPNLWAAGTRFDWERLTRAHDWIDDTLRSEGSITFTFADGTASTLTPVTVCATRFEISGDGKIAVADGTRVVFGVEFPGFAYPQEVFAGGVAHELAHNVLEHDRWLDTYGRSRRNVRRAEREADRLMPWLLANAGFDPANAVAFMQTWGPDHDGGLWRKRTHDGWDERVERIEAELPTIRQLMAKDGVADWRVHFRREISPQSEAEVAARD